MINQIVLIGILILILYVIIYGMDDVLIKIFPTITDKKEYYHENECKKIIETLTGKKFYKVRPDFLRNPKTGHNLELDCYNKELY